MPMDNSPNGTASPYSASSPDGANYSVDCDSSVQDDPSRQCVSPLSLGDGVDEDIVAAAAAAAALMGSATDP